MKFLVLFCLFLSVNIFASTDNCPKYISTVTDYGQERNYCTVSGVANTAFKVTSTMYPEGHMGLKYVYLGALASGQVVMDIFMSDQGGTAPNGDTIFKCEIVDGVKTAYEIEENGKINARHAQVDEHFVTDLYGADGSIVQTWSCDLKAY